MALAHNLDGEPVTEHVHFKGTRIERAAATLAWLQANTALFEGADVVIYERPFARGFDATRSLWGVAALIEATAGPYAYVTDATPTEIKKWVTGKGSGGKPDMLLFAFTLGYGGDNEHEADAFGLLRYAEARGPSLLPTPPVKKGRKKNV